MSINRTRYRALCESENIPLFAHAWWLDAVAGEQGWDAVLLEKGGRCVAALPFAIKRKFGLTMIGMPVLTQSLGPWVRYPESQKTGKRYAFEKDVFQALIDELPRAHGFVQNFNPAVRNWLPFYWRGFSETTKYSYVLEDLTNLDNVWSGFLDNVRTDIRKASKQVFVDNDADIDSFVECHEKVFERQGLTLPYSLDTVRRLDAAAAQRGQRRIFLARDAERRVHAGIYLVWDDSCAYYLMGAGDPELRSSGATSLAMWEAIRFASTVTKSFDFEGSMLEPVERFFRAFGATQLPYFQVSRHGRLMTVARSVQAIARTIRARG